MTPCTRERQGDATGQNEPQERGGNVQVGVTPEVDDGADPQGTFKYGGS